MHLVTMLKENTHAVEPHNVPILLGRTKKGEIPGDFKKFVERWV